jgi:hypothetical protein
MAKTSKKKTTKKPAKKKTTTKSKKTKSVKTKAKTTKKKIKETGCCKPFNPKLWDKKTKVFKNKLFVKAHVMSFFHIPLNFAPVMKRTMKKIMDAKAETKEPLMMVDEKSLWGADVYIEVTKNVPNAKMEKISGTFICKVYEGPYKNMGSWIRDMKKYVMRKKKKIKKLYFFYTMCPSCAKAYGQNYTVLLAKV